MIGRAVNGCVSFMVGKGVVGDTPEQREIYAYGLELQIHYIINAAVLLAIGILFKQAIEVAALLFLFGLIQANGGGYHADSHIKCLLLMVTGTFLFLFLLPKYQNIVSMQLLSVLGGAASVICLAPVAHRNHPLNPQLSKKMGKRAKCLVCALSLTWFVLFPSEILPGASGLLSLVIALSGFSMIAARIKNRLNFN